MAAPPHVCTPLLQLSHTGVVFHCGDGSALSGAQVRDRVAGWAHTLRSGFALRPGEVVALAAGTTADFIHAWLAITAVGGVAALLNTKWSASEAAAAARRVGAVLVVTDSTGVAAARALRADNHSLRGMALLEDVKLCESDFGAVPVHALREPTSGMELPLLRSGVDDICTLVFTSGSTATPKAAALTHGNIHAASQAKLQVVGYSVRDIYMHAAPLCHIGGLSSAHAALSAAAVHVFPTGGAFRAGEAIRLVRKHRVTAFIAVPTMLHDLLRTLDGGDAQPLLGVTKLLVGGGAASHSLLERTTTRLVPKAHVIGTYALSEACSSCAFRTIAVAGAMTAPPPALDRAAAAVVTGGVCCGTPAPACTLRISDDGEICVAGPQVMARYWGDAAGTAAALVHDQTTDRLWLHTGDLGRLDTSGRLWLFGRAADVIKSGGENIHAAEVETALCSHSAVVTAVVVPVTHDRWGTAVTACIMLKPGYSWHGPCVPEPSSRAKAESRGAEGAALTPSALCAHVTSNSVGLARFKAPRLIAAWTGSAALPMGTTGKVDKRAIAAVMSALVRATPTAWLDATYVRSRL